MRKILIIFFVILSIAITFSLVKNFSWHPFGSNKQEAKVTDRVKQLELDIRSAKVTIVSEKRDTVKAELEGRGSVSVKKKGNIIMVDYSQPKFRVFPFFNNPELTIFIPHDYKENLNIDLGSGTINFSNDEKEIATFDKIDLDIGSGSVKLENISTNRISLEMGSGNFTAEGITADQGIFEVNSGRAVLKEYSGELDIELSSGKFTADIKELTAPIDASVSSGILTLNLPDDSHFTLKTKVSSGTISNDFPVEVKKQEKRRFSGTYGEGTHEINIDVSSGMVNINKK